jgi:hypothetical protein
VLVTGRKLRFCQPYRGHAADRRLGRRHDPRAGARLWLPRRYSR